MPKDPTQSLNYNHIKRHEIKSEKTSVFYLLKETQHLQVLNKVQHVCPLSVNATVYLVHRARVSAFSVDDEHSDESEELINY